MRKACDRSRQALRCDHPRLTRIWRVRNAWLEKGNECKGKIAPGAFCRQKSGKPVPEWRVSFGQLKRQPVAKENVCHIYAVVHLKNGKTYVGRTIQNPYVRFQQHIRTGDALGKAILLDDSKFAVLILEVLPKLFPCQLPRSGVSWHWRKRENAWINKLNPHRNGYNTRR